MRVPAVILAMAVGLGVLTACGSGGGKTPRGSGGSAKVPKVVFIGPGYTDFTVRSRPTRH
jgi:hypothetical protein